jgi:hypothetical protein
MKGSGASGVSGASKFLSKVEGKFVQSAMN